MHFPCVSANSVCSAYRFHPAACKGSGAGRMVPVSAREILKEPDNFVRMGNLKVTQARVFSPKRHSLREIFIY